MMAYTDIDAIYLAAAGLALVGLLLTVRLYQRGGRDAKAV